MAEEYDFEKLAREIVSSQMPAGENAPDAALKIAMDILITGVKSTGTQQDPRLTVIAVCRGVLDGMLISNRDICDPAVRLLKLMPDIAHEAHLDPGDLMTWAMEGIAAVAATAGAEFEHNIQTRIDETFMGAGEVFARLCHQVRKP